MTVMAIDFKTLPNSAVRFHRSPMLVVSESPTIQKAKQRNIQEEISLYQRLKTIQMDEKYCINKININKRLTQYKFRATVNLSSDLQSHRRMSFNDVHHQRKSNYRHQRQIQPAPPPSSAGSMRNDPIHRLRSNSHQDYPWLRENLSHIVTKWRNNSGHDRYNPPFEETYAYINTMPHARPPSSLASYWVPKKQRSKKQALINYEHNQRLLERELRINKPSSP